LLFDTSTWIWSLMEPERLSEAVREAIAQSEQNVFYLSAASAWEIAVKDSLGTVELPGPPGEIVPADLVKQGILSLPITNTHALAVADLPFHHADPFDRLLIAQAKIEGMAVLTNDRALRHERGLVILPQRDP
jgi:PIN domain nuclease of toxin-antitoxin system